MEQAQQARDMAKCEATEEDFRDWLRALGLPTLEEEMKLGEAAHQLCIVLVERLMLWPWVR